MSFALITPDLPRVDYDDADAALDAITSMIASRSPAILCGVDGGRVNPPIMETGMGLTPALDLHALARKAGVA